MSIEHLYHLYLKHQQVTTDTRKVKQGDIFFALKGENFDGNKFASEALSKGASVVVVDKLYDHSLSNDARVMIVEDSLQALQQLALYHRSQMAIPFLAITGSNGKTTTKELIYAVLSKKYKTTATVGNLNNHIGVPLTLLSISPDTEMAIIEMGANHQKEIEGYCQIAKPTHGLITNVGKAHLEGFGGIEGVKKGKGELYDYLRTHGGVLFRNTQLAYLNEMAKDAEQQVTYGTHEAQYRYMVLHDNAFAAIAVMNNGYECSIHSQLVGTYNAPNLMAAATLGLYFGVPIDDIKEAIESYAPDNSRSQLMQVGTNQIILDAYNANPSSMKAAVENFAAHAGKNKHLYIGGMKEMGAEEKQEHTALLQLIDQHEWSSVIIVGKEFAAIKHPYRYFATSEDAAAYVKHNIPEQAIILIKGSRGSKMEVLLEALQGK